MNPSILLVGAALFTWGIGEGMFFYFVPLYMQQFGASPIWIGSILGGFGFVMMCAHIPAGLLSDRLGRRPLLRLAWLIGMAAAWGMALAPSLPLFVTAYLFYGLTAFVSSPLFSYVTAARGELSAGRVMTLTSAMYNLGAVIGPVSGGWLGDHFGLQSTFLGAALVFIPSVVLLFFLPPQPRETHDGDGGGWQLLSNRRFWGFLVLVFLTMFAMYLPQPLTPNFLQNERGVSFSQLGWIGSAGSLGNVLFNLGLGQLSPTLGFALGQACVGLFALLLWQGDALPWYAAAYFLMGGYRAARMLVFAQVRWLIHQAQMGLAYGITEAVNSSAVILAPLLAGFLYDKDPASIYAWSLLLIALGVVLSLVFTPRSPSLPQHSPIPNPQPGDRHA
ncbi:MAG: MFS transporter [Chloroflexota bacterium]